MCNGEKMSKHSADAIGAAYIRWQGSSRPTDNAANVFVLDDLKCRILLIVGKERQGDSGVVWGCIYFYFPPNALCLSWSINHGPVAGQPYKDKTI